MRGALDARLEAASAPVAELEHSALRLQNDARFPWLVLIPRGPGLIELCDLEAAHRAAVFEEAVRAGQCLRRAAAALAYPIDKLNIAAIGNVVAQLHLHVVGRRLDDALWPDPVWGQGAAIPYPPERLEAWRGAILEALNQEA